MSYTRLNAMLRDYERTQSISVTELVRVALDCADAEQLAATLQARPDVAVGALSAVRVAGPWMPSDDEGGEIWERRLPDPCGGTLAMATLEPDGGWRTMLLLPGDPDDDNDEGECVDGMVHHRTRAAAMAAADAALVAQGWALAGGAP